MHRAERTFALKKRRSRTLHLVFIEPWLVDLVGCYVHRSHVLIGRWPDDRSRISLRLVAHQQLLQGHRCSFSASIHWSLLDDGSKSCWLPRNDLFHSLIQQRIHKWKHGRRVERRQLRNIRRQILGDDHVLRWLRATLLVHGRFQKRCHRFKMFQVVCGKVVWVFRY